jgi:hypothetical protein
MEGASDDVATARVVRRKSILTPTAAAGPRPVEPDPEHEAGVAEPGEESYHDRR